MRIKFPISRTLVSALAAVSFSISGAPPCFALTANDVTKNMTNDQRAGYLSGLVDMRAMVAEQLGDSTVPRCIHEAFDIKTGAADDGWAKIYKAFDQFPDKEASMIVFLIVKKLCGG